VWENLYSTHILFFLMLDEEEIEKIKKLINQGKTNYKIGKELEHSANTVKNIREEYNNAKVSHTTGEETHFDGPIEEVRGIVHNIDNLIKKGQLKAGEKRIWEKILKQLQEILRLEVDERIPAERSEAINLRDEQWREIIQKGYVKKEVATDLENTIKSRDATNDALRNEIVQKDNLFSNEQYEISQLIDSHQLEIEDLKSKIRSLSWEKQGLVGENWNMHYIIQGYQYYYDQGEQEYQKRERELSNEKTTFNKERKEQEVKSDKAFFEVDKKYKEIERREKQLDEQTVKLKKREAELDKNRTKMYDLLEEKIKAIKKREQNVSNLEKGLKRWNDEQNDGLDTKRKKIKDDQEKITQEWETIKKTVEELRTEKHRLQEWQKLLNKTQGFNKFSLPCPHCEKPMLFDANNQETYQKINQTFGNYMHPECRVKSEQQKHVILRPVSLSGEPVIHSGSPIIQSGGEPIVVESSGKPVMQSGYPPCYYSGTEILNKNGKKGVTVSS